MISLYKYIGNLTNGCYFLCSHVKEKKRYFFLSTRIQYENKWETHHILNMYS